MKQHSSSSALFTSAAVAFAFVSMFFIAPLNAQNPEISIHYLGHSSFIIQFDNGLYVLMDYGTSYAYGLDSPIYNIGSLQPDIITYSHKHEDHYNPDRMPDSVRYVLTLHDTLSLEGLEIRPVRTSETSLSVKSNSSFIFSYKGLTLIHLGDAQANIMNIDNKQNRNYIRSIFPEKIDMLLMTIQGISQFIPQAEAFVDFLQPQRIIPMHYWTREYKADFLDYLESQNQNAGKNYQIDRRKGAKYAISIADTSIVPIEVISLEPAPFSDFNQPEIWHDDFELNDSKGNNNGRADAGETVMLAVSLVNYWVGATNVSVTLRENDPDVQVINSVVNFGNIGSNQNCINTENPFTFSVSSTALAHYTKFYLDIKADNNYVTVDSLETIIGTPSILLIDDDGGSSYQTSYTDLIIPENWDVMKKGCPTLDLFQQYESVIWSTGDDRENSLTMEEQSTIAAFLDNGGKLLICGQNIASDLAGDGSESDSLFFANYLHAQFVNDSTDATVALGVTGDPVSGRMMIGLAKTPAGDGKKSSPDVINAIVPEELIFKYIPGMAGAGLKYENTATGARVVYLGFGIEKISGPKTTTAADFLEKVLTWLAGTTSVDNETKQHVLPKDYWLSQNFPNPFNPNTTIQYSIPRADFVVLKVYNLIGKKIATLVQKTQSAGTYRVTFNGELCPSGVYFYQLQAGTFRATKKFVLLR